MKIQKLLPGFEIFQFLTNFSVNSSLILNSIYFMQKKKIQNMLQVYFRKINCNLKIFRLYQNINSNINHSNMRGVNQNLKL